MASSLCGAARCQQPFLLTSLRSRSNLHSAAFSKSCWRSTSLGAGCQGHCRFQVSASARLRIRISFFSLKSRQQLKTKRGCNGPSSETPAFDSFAVPRRPFERAPRKSSCLALLFVSTDSKQTSPQDVVCPVCCRKLPQQAFSMRHQARPCRRFLFASTLHCSEASTRERRRQPARHGRQTSCRRQLVLLPRPGKSGTRGLSGGEGHGLVRLLSLFAQMSRCH